MDVEIDCADATVETTNPSARIEEEMGFIAVLSFSAPVRADDVKSSNDRSTIQRSENPTTRLNDARGEPLPKNPNEVAETTQAQVSMPQILDPSCWSPHSQILEHLANGVLDAFHSRV